jgi:DNA-directed RNA polymerase specialized sigma24 family protein
MDLDLMADTAADRSDGEVLRWFDELCGPLRRYLICSGASATDADDAVQESFLRLHRHLESKGDRSNLYGWVFQERAAPKNEDTCVRRGRSGFQC